MSEIGNELHIVAGELVEVAQAIRGAREDLGEASTIETGAITDNEVSYGAVHGARSKINAVDAALESFDGQLDVVLSGLSVSRERLSELVAPVAQAIGSHDTTIGSLATANDHMESSVGHMRLAVEKAESAADNCQRVIGQSNNSIEQDAVQATGDLRANVVGATEALTAYKNDTSDAPQPLFVEANQALEEALAAINEKDTALVGLTAIIKMASEAIKKVRQDLPGLNDKVIESQVKLVRAIDAIKEDVRNTVNMDLGLSEVQRQAGQLASDIHTVADRH